MPRKAKDVQQKLLKKGFSLVTTPKDHYYYIVYHNGKKTSVNTKISHGCKEISDGLLSKMRRQMRLEKDDFERYMICTMSKEEYIDFLIKNNHIEG